MSANDNDHPALLTASALLDAEMDRVLTAGRSGKITPEEQSEALERLAVAIFSLLPNATAADVKRVLGED